MADLIQVIQLEGLSLEVASDHFDFEGLDFDMPRPRRLRATVSAGTRRRYNVSRARVHVSIGLNVPNGSSRGPLLELPDSDQLVKLVPADVPAEQRIVADAGYRAPGRLEPEGAPRVRATGTMSFDYTYNSTTLT